MRIASAILVAAVSLSTAWGQQQTTGSSTTQPRSDSVHQVDPGQMYNRIYAIVPMVGSGTLSDPKRPMFAPAPSQAQPSAVHTGVIGFQMWPSDDGNWALVEFVGATPADLQSIVGAASATVQVFPRGKFTQAQIEAAFQQYKKGFKFEWFTARAQ